MNLEGPPLQSFGAARRRKTGLLRWQVHRIHNPGKEIEEIGATVDKLLAPKKR